MAARDQIQMSLVLTEIRRETPDIKSFRFELESDIPFQFRPGQFVILSAELWNPKRQRMGPVNRAFSISSSPTDKDYIEIAAKRYPSGRLTTWLHDAVKAGDRLAIKGPEGQFIFEEGEADEIVLIAGGIGIAPYRSMIRYILARRLSTKIALLYSARTPADFAFKPELDAATKMHGNIRCVYTITRPDGTNWPHRVARFDNNFFREHLGPPGTVYYICGPAMMIKQQIQILSELGIEPSLIRSERW